MAADTRSCVSPSFEGIERMTVAMARSPVVERAAPLLEVAALSKRYRDQDALAHVSFDVRAGEVLGLIGPNGAGKTTLLEAMAGVLPFDAGEVRWRGAPLPT